MCEVKKRLVEQADTLEWALWKILTAFNAQMNELSIAEKDAFQLAVGTACRETERALMAVEVHSLDHDCDT